jgi:hypothetical protein
MSPLRQYILEEANPYLYKIASKNGIDIYRVDGEWIRNNKDEEFTNFGSHIDFKFIPKNEFWLDIEKQEGETHIYIERMIYERRLYIEGEPFEVIKKKANTFEAKSRKDIRKGDKLNKTLIKEIKGIKIYKVNGQDVRDTYYVPFTEGGNGQRYTFIPENEIWLDNDLVEDEIKYVTLHEYIEQNIMKKFNYSYDKAHAIASEKEHIYRKELPNLTIEEAINKLATNL